MNKPYVGIGIALIWLCLLTGVNGVDSLKTQKKPTCPETIVIESSFFGEKRSKGVVEFSHNAHANLERYRDVSGDISGDVTNCVKCHHAFDETVCDKEKILNLAKNDWENGALIPKCQSCHPVKKDKTCIILKKAFHQQCVGCHKRHVDKWVAGGKIGEKPKAPLKKPCSKCHQKK